MLTARTIIQIFGIDISEDDDGKLANTLEILEKTHPLCRVLRSSKSISDIVKKTGMVIPKNIDPYQYIVDNVLDYEDHITYPLNSLTLEELSSSIEKDRLLSRCSDSTILSIFEIKPKYQSRNELMANAMSYSQKINGNVAILCEGLLKDDCLNLYMNFPDGGSKLLHLRKLSFGSNSEVFVEGLKVTKTMLRQIIRYYDSILGNQFSPEIQPILDKIRVLI